MQSTAFGASTTANAQFSTAFGSGTLATGAASTAFGSGTTASANSSTAMGFGTSAGGDYSTSMGYNTGAGGDYSVVAGNQSSTVGNSSMAIGSFASAIGNYSFAQGNQTKARGICSISMGEMGESRGYASSTFGQSNISKGYSSMVVGMYNDSILNVDQSSSSSLTPLFIVGNGSSSITRSNALVVRKDGHVGIGTSSPDFLLDVSGRMRIESDGGSNTAGIWFNKGDNSDLAAFLGMYNDNYVGLYGSLGVGWNFVMNTANGFVGIGTVSPSQKLSVNGNICYTGSIGACSDIRYKKNIHPISHALDNLLLIHGIYYNWNKEKFSEKAFTDDRQIGFSAQEIEKLFPEMVQTDADGYKSVDYSRMTPVLVEAIKEQQQQIEALMKRIQQLEKPSAKTHHR
jgi:hypothetical protein